MSFPKTRQSSGEERKILGSSAPMTVRESKRGRKNSISRLVSEKGGVIAAVRKGEEFQFLISANWERGGEGERPLFRSA